MVMTSVGWLRQRIQALAWLLASALASVDRDMHLGKVAPASAKSTSKDMTWLIMVPWIMIMKMMPRRSQRRNRP